MATVSERVRETIDQARIQIEDFEKQVPAQLKGAFERVVERLRHALAFATREELSTLTEKVDALAKKVNHLIRGDKDKGGANRKTSKPA